MHYWITDRPPSQSEIAGFTTQPRRFASLTRTINAQGFTTLDAIDQDGRAWWLVLGDDAAPDEWSELLPLPTREEQP